MIDKCFIVSIKYQKQPRMIDFFNSVKVRIKKKNYLDLNQELSSNRERSCFIDINYHFVNIKNDSYVG